MVPNEHPAMLTWRKATKSYCESNCVELTSVRSRILVRDSKNPDGPHLSFTAGEWDAFLDGAKKGEFDDLL